MAVIPSAYNALMGMFSTRQPQNVSGSIYDMARADAQKQMLAQIGGGLMAAAVPQTATMRAQALQSAFSNMGNIGNSVYNAAQLRLAEQKQKKEADLIRAAENRLSGMYGGQGVAEDVALPSSTDFSQFGPRIQPATQNTQPSPSAPQSEIGSLINPDQARIAAPPAPSATAPMRQRSFALTPAEIARIEDLRLLEGPVAAANYLSEIQYKKSQPREPKGELALGVAALRDLGIGEDRISDFINKSIDGQPTEFERIVQAYIMAPEGSDEKRLLGKRLQRETEYQPLEIERLIDLYNNAEDEETKSTYKTLIAKKIAPTGMRIETAPDGTVSVVQGDASPGEGAFSKKVGQIEADLLKEMKSTAEAAAKDIKSNNRLVGLIESGVRFGVGGDFINKLSRELQNLGIVEGDNAQTNTAQWMRETGKKAAEMLSSGDFGSGTGVSDNDLKQVMMLAGKDPTQMTQEEALLMIKVNNAKSVSILDEYNSQFFEPYSQENNLTGWRRNLWEVKMPEIREYTPPAPLQEWNPNGTLAQ